MSKKTFYVTLQPHVVEEVIADKVSIEAGGTLVFSNYCVNDKEYRIVLAYAPTTWTAFVEG